MIRQSFRLPPNVVFGKSLLKQLGESLVAQVRSSNHKQDATPRRRRVLRLDTQLVLWLDPTTGPQSRRLPTIRLRQTELQHQQRPPPRAPQPRPRVRSE